MIEPTPFVYRDVTYLMAPLPATKGCSVLTRIIRLLGPAIGAALGDKGGLTGLLEKDVSGLGNAVQVLASNLDDAVVRGIIRDLLEPVRVRDGDRLAGLNDVFDAHFAAEYDRLLAVLAEALKVNFGSFQRGVASRLAAATPTKQQAGS